MPSHTPKSDIVAASSFEPGTDNAADIPAERRRTDNRDVARDNELAVLMRVRWYGHLRRAEIARSVWNRSTLSSATKMAQRTVARLIDKGELLERTNLLSGRSLVLSRRGAARLRNECDLDANDGCDISSVCGPHFVHRTLGSRYLIERAARGDEVYGEHALLQDWGPLTRHQFVARFGKVPDGLVLSRGANRGMDAHVYAADWIEIENSYKPRRQLDEIFAIALEKIPAMKPGDDLILDRVVFVYDVRHRHEQRIMRALSQHMVRHPLLDRPYLPNIVLVRCYIDTPLAWQDYEEIDCGEIMRMSGR